MLCCFYVVYTIYILIPHDSDFVLINCNEYIKMSDVMTFEFSSKDDVKNIVSNFSTLPTLN